MAETLETTFYYIFSIKQKYIWYVETGFFFLGFCRKSKYLVSYVIIYLNISWLNIYVHQHNIMRMSDMYVKKPIGNVLNNRCSIFPYTMLCRSLKLILYKHIYTCNYLYTWGDLRSYFMREQQRFANYWSNFEMHILRCNNIMFIFYFFIRKCFIE